MKSISVTWSFAITVYLYSNRCPRHVKNINKQLFVWFPENKWICNQIKQIRILTFFTPPNILLGGISVGWPLWTWNGWDGSHLFPSQTPTNWKERESCSSADATSVYNDHWPFYFCNRFYTDPRKVFSKISLECLFWRNYSHWLHSFILFCNACL